MKMSSVCFLALVLASVSQTSLAADDSFPVVFKQRIDLPENNTSKKTQVEKTNYAINSKTFCTVSVDAPPYAQPSIPADRQLIAKSNGHSTFYLFDSSTDKLAAIIYCELNGMPLSEALRKTLNVSTAYEIKAGPEDTIEQDSWVLPAT